MTTLLLQVIQEDTDIERTAYIAATKLNTTGLEKTWIEAFGDIIKDIFGKTEN